MAKDLTTSAIERQNVLNNALDIEAYHFEGKYYLTKQMVADFYEVDVRTIERYLETNKEELERNGYFLCRGKRLKEFKLQFAPDINVGHKTVSLSLFVFRAFLNIGMLLAESEKAKRIRSLILDIVISTINEKAGGGTKYINWRDRDFLPAAIQEENYRKNLTAPINDYVDGHPTYKYASITDMIYKAVFHENAKQYKELLKLEPKDNAKATMYAEVLRVISSFENGVGSAIRDLSVRLHRKISRISPGRVLQMLLECLCLLCKHIPESLTQVSCRLHIIRTSDFHFSTLTSLTSVTFVGEGSEGSEG